MLKKWDSLPSEFKTEEVKRYYEILKRKKFSLFLKRLFDVLVSLILLSIALPFFIILAIVIKIDSRGPVFYRQERVTSYNKKFRIFKFRTMVFNADKKGSLITGKNDCRITRVGKFIRKCRLDEVSQLIDVLRGKMTFVGTRPEVPKYVEKYTPEMYATLLLPAGVTSTASIKFKDEDEILEKHSGENVDTVYVEKILPEKMKYNLNDIENFGFFRDISIMFKTAVAIFKR
ncbi:MAG: sugar transferase [Clostridia bacterium]|nr:sugar transferase [Clostridia bacterium]